MIKQKNTLEYMVLDFLRSLVFQEDKTFTSSDLVAYVRGIGRHSFSPESAPRVLRRANQRSIKAGSGRIYAQTADGFEPLVAGLLGYLMRINYAPARKYS